MKDNSVKQKFIELRALGKSYTYISAELNVSKQTLINWSREYQIQISNLKAIELDSLQRRLHLSSEARLELFGTMLERMKAEFQKRDLSEVTSEKLVDQILKLTAVIDKEYAVPQFWEKKPSTLAENLEEMCTKDERWFA